MRLLHLLVIGVLVFAAAYVYRIKIEFDRAHRARAAAAAEIRESATPSPALRAEWAKLDAPSGSRGWPSAICR